MKKDTLNFYKWASIVFQVPLKYLLPPVLEKLSARKKRAYEEYCNYIEKMRKR